MNKSMKLSVVVILTAFSSCFSQNNTSIIFMNNSSHEVDSVVLQHAKKEITGKIKPGENYTFKLENIVLDNGREGGFGFSVYTNKKIFSGGWGFHDFGGFARHSETFYIYDNGINYINKPIVKPSEFKLYFYNYSSETIDSIYSLNNSIIKTNEYSPRNREIVYNYNKLENNPWLLIRLSGKEYRKKIIFPTDWNNNQSFFSFLNDSLVYGTKSWTEPLEFIIDLEIKTSDNIDSVGIESESIIKVYNFTQPKYKRIIFDYKRFKTNPSFKIYVRNKIFTGRLSNDEFSNVYFNQKIFFLYENGVRNLP